MSDEEDLVVRLDLDDEVESAVFRESSEDALEWTLNVAIGLISYEGNLKFMGGPISSIDKHSEKYVIFRPGFTERKIVIRKLSESFGAESIDIEKLLPSGGFDLVKSKGIQLKL